MARLKKTVDEEIARRRLRRVRGEARASPRRERSGLVARTYVSAERADTKYNLAHPRGYVRIAGSEILPAVGIPLDRQRLWMDRSTISRLTRDGYLEVDPVLHSASIPTDRGGRVLPMEDQKFD